VRNNNYLGLPVWQETQMAQWQRKQANSIADAATAFMHSICDETAQVKLAKIVRLAKAVERTDCAGAYTLTALRTELCGFCSNEKLFPCRAYQQQNGCAFVETGLTLTPSYFGALS
jgi:hypothetical protein